MRAHLRRYIEVARAHGVERVRIEHRGQPHPRLKGRVGGRELEMVVGGTTHQSGCSLKNGLARLRRKIRTLRSVGGANTG